MFHLSIKENLFSIYKSLVEQALILLIPVLILRLFDYNLAESYVFTTGFEKVEALFIIFYKELKLILLYLLSIGLALAFIKLRFKNTYTFLTFIFTFLFLLIYLFVTQYFYTANIRLDHVILSFSFSEIKYIASTEFSTLFNKFFLLYLSTLLSFIVLFIYRKKLLSRLFSTKTRHLVSLLILLGIGSIGYFKKSKLNVKKELWVSSKPYYLLDSIYNHYKHGSGGTAWEGDRVKFIEHIKSFREFMNWESSIIQNEFPLLRKYNWDKGDLSTYFHEFDSPPNLVMVFCEGLSSSFSGPKARLGSLTPILDSIYAKSLYWPNTLSNTDRTFGVFSNALASLPPGFERGMLNIKVPFPEHVSLPKILSNNGYKSSFTYGGWGYFDNYEPFLKMNQVDFIFDEVFMEKEGIITKERDKETYPWGLPDKELIQVYLEKLKSRYNQEPYFDIILTSSLHSPYNIPNQEDYMKVVRKRLEQMNGDVGAYKNHNKEVSAVIYQDEAIGNLMRAYQKREDYENTIFLFVGDHNVRAFPMDSWLESHHVPLAIYSPKLKQAKEFQDIVSQADIPQSILSVFAPYIEKNLLPENNAWVGEGLSFNDKTIADKPIFLGRFSGDLVGVVYQDTLLLDRELYLIRDFLKISPLNNAKERKDFFLNQLQNYSEINSYVVNNQKIISDPEVSMFPNLKVDFYFPEDEE